MNGVNWRAVLAEFIGTFIFFTVGAGAVVLNQFTNGAVGLIGIAAAHGLILSIMVSSFGATSGGHFNPAVSIAMLITGRLNAISTALYVVVQVAGGVLAGLLLRSVYADQVWRAASLGIPTVNANVTIGAAFLIEAVATFILLTAIFGTAVDDRAPKTIGGFGIGLAVFADILWAGPLTGASMNPARTFGPQIAAGMFENWWLYWAAPIIGGAVAALVYQHFILKPREAA